MIYERRLMMSLEIEFSTLADEALSAKYRPVQVRALPLIDDYWPLGRAQARGP